MTRDKEEQGQEKGENTTTPLPPSYITGDNMRGSTFLVMDGQSAIIDEIGDETFDALRLELLKYRDLAQKAQNIYLNTPWYNVFKLFKLKLAVKLFSSREKQITQEIELLIGGVML